jgi:CubicO group peptidase (beta-lactamase class C family)
MRLALLLAAVVSCFCGVANGAPASKFSSSVDAIFAQYDSVDVPGCAVGVIRNGEYIHARGYGSANLEHGIPIDRDSVFRVGSVSKQFTAAAIAILAGRGDLDLDADVHTYLPDLGKYDDLVTIRQMIHHISGIVEYDGDATPTSYEVRDGKPFRFGNEDYWSIQEFYNEVASQKQPLARKPGVSYEYSNTAYFLLSQVVERVSGKTLRHFADEEIFRPLQMNATFFNDNVNGIVPNRADGYRPLDQGGFEIYMTNLSWVGDGGIYTSLNDFIKWDQAFITGKVPGGVAVQRLMLEPDPTTVKTMEKGLLDEGAGYGFGLEIGTYKGHPVHMHTGSWVGFRAFYARFPEDGFSIVTLCNRSDAGSDDTNRKLLDLALSEFR